MKGASEHTQSAFSKIKGASERMQSAFPKIKGASAHMQSAFLATIVESCMAGLQLIHIPESSLHSGGSTREKFSYLDASISSPLG